MPDVIFPLRRRRVWVAGHKGMVGSALIRRLAREECEILTVDRATVDLSDQGQVRGWVKGARPDAIFFAAAKVGGIHANDTYAADFIYDNLIIEANIIEAAFRANVKKLMFLGSSCIYPKFADQPIQEDALLSAPLEPTNQRYAVAKIAGIKLCQAYRKQYGCDFMSAMPTNLYGPGDNFDLRTSHVLPALMRKTHESRLSGDKELVVWGTGKPRREFLHVDDCADALVYLMKIYSEDQHINVGSGKDVTILELTRKIMKVVGYKGKVAHDLSKPDGPPRKLMSGKKLRSLGWSPSIPLEEGLISTYAAFLRGQRSRRLDGLTVRPSLELNASP